jgi:hypothetical protein
MRGRVYSNGYLVEWGRGWREREGKGKMEIGKGTKAIGN